MLFSTAMEDQFYNTSTQNNIMKYTHWLHDTYKVILLLV